MAHTFVASQLQILINCEVINLSCVHIICMSTDTTNPSSAGCPLDHSYARDSFPVDGKNGFKYTIKHLHNANQVGQ